MASWQLEVFKMFLYVMFPVASFYVFNHPDVYNKCVGDAKESMKAFHSDEFRAKIKEIQLQNHKKLKEKKLEESPLM